MLAHLARILAASLLTLLLTATTTAQALFDPLIGAVTDPDGAPVAGAKVQAFRAGGRGTCLLDLDYRDDHRLVAELRTDRAGRFALQLPAGLPCRLVVDHAPHARWLREDCLPGLDVAVRLQRPATVRGRVTHHDGAPAKASLRAWNRETLDEVLRGETDAQGRYRFDRVAPGPLYLEVTPARAPAPQWLRTNLTAGQELEHDFELRVGVHLRGRVVDAATGAPIAGARIGEGWTLHRATVTDADGGYELVGAGSDGYGDVRCVAAGFVTQVVPGELQGPEARLDFRMPRGTGVTGRVVDDRGRPVEGAYVQAFAFAAATVHYHDLVTARTDADGRFALGGLTPNSAHALVLRKDGYGALAYALPEPDGATAALRDLVLRRARIVRGTLRDPDRRPVAGAAVFLHGYNADRHALAPDGALARGAATEYDGWGLLDRYVGRRTVRTDNLGRFAFGDVAPGTYLVVGGDVDRGTALADTALLEVGVDGQLPPIELTTPR